MAQDLKDHIAIISGALGDIGKAIALDLARRGADIALGDIQESSAASKVLLEIETLNAHAAYHQVDVANSEAIQHWLDDVEIKLGIPNLIIPNAAIVKTSSLTEISSEDWNSQLNVNLSGAFFLAQNASKRLLKAQLPGRIVFVGSWAAHAPHINMIPYSVSKAGLRMLCKCMALELASHRILVNEIAPGYVDAGLSGKLFDTNPALRKSATEKVPTHQLITAEEVAAQVAYLCDPQNKQMTGSTLLMDGGLSLQTR
jgi:NAD(P)-dependent dehydrogenase (short-subunit alcohol dehydrogenase family)